MHTGMQTHTRDTCTQICKHTYTRGCMHAGVQTHTSFHLGNKNTGCHTWPSGFLSVPFLWVSLRRWFPVRPCFEGCHSYLRNVCLIFIDCACLLPAHELKYIKLWLVQEYFTVLASKAYYDSKRSWGRFLVYLYNVFSVYFTNCLSYG